MTRLLAFSLTLVICNCVYAPNAQVLEPDQGPAIAADSISTDSLDSFIEAHSLEESNLDAVGLLPSRVTGLPVDLWRNSKLQDIVDLFEAQTPDLAPAALQLLYMLLLAEATPPSNSNGTGRLLFARIDKLVEFGALEQARELLRRAGTSGPGAFGRWFDIGLLTNSEFQGCSTMLIRPSIAPSNAALIFCNVRQGHWANAQLIFEAANALGEFTEEEATIISLFLSPELFSEMGTLVPTALTPLTFRMLKDSGHPYAVTNLPDNLLFQNLASETAWRSRIESAEVLVRNAAIPFELLLLVYSEHQPSASGGIWDRVSVMREFDIAVLLGESVRIESLLPKAMQAMRSIGLSVQFSRYFLPRTINLGVDIADRSAKFEFTVLAGNLPAASERLLPRSESEAFIRTTRLGRYILLKPRSSIEIAVKAGLARPPLEGRLRGLYENGQVGEALLEAILQIGDGIQTDPQILRDTLSILRKAKLDSVARELAIQILMQEWS